jgi:cyclophilin family peptidyl-prolyl cis-trans isomerase
MIRPTRLLCAVLATFLCLCGTTWAEEKAVEVANPTVVMTTSQGTIEIELWPDRAPISVENFLGYVDKGFYDGTIFHRVIKGFMIQGGGFDKDMMKKGPLDAPIKNEADHGLSNETGTIAMARTSVVDSATAQFFINTVDNKKLDHSGPGSRFGYAVFGKVTSGMDVVKAIEASPTTAKGRMRDVPAETIVIESVKRKP